MSSKKLTNSVWYCVKFLCNRYFPSGFTKNDEELLQFFKHPPGIGLCVGAGVGVIINVGVYIVSYYFFRDMVRRDKSAGAVLILPIFGLPLFTVYSIPFCAFIGGCIGILYQGLIFILR